MVWRRTLRAANLHLPLLYRWLARLNVHLVYLRDLRRAAFVDLRI